MKGRAREGWGWGGGEKQQEEECLVSDKRGGGGGVEEGFGAVMGDGVGT